MPGLFSKSRNLAVTCVTVRLVAKQLLFRLIHMLPVDVLEQQSRIVPAGSAVRTKLVVILELLHEHFGFGLLSELLPGQCCSGKRARLITDVWVKHMRRSILMFSVMGNVLTNSVEHLIIVPTKDRCLYENQR